MSTEDNANQEEIVQPETVAPVEAVAAAPSEAGGLLSSILSLKDSNPKVFLVVLPA